MTCILALSKTGKITPDRFSIVNSFDSSGRGRYLLFDVLENRILIDLLGNKTSGALTSKP